MPGASKNQTQNSRIWIKERFIGGEVTKKEVAKPIFCKYKVQTSFMSQEGEMGGATGNWLLHTSGHQQGSDNYCASWCESIMRFLQIFDKQYILTLPPQTASRIPVMTSTRTSICKTKQKVLVERPWEQRSLNKMESERLFILLCHINLNLS